MIASHVGGGTQKCGRLAGPVVCKGDSVNDARLRVTIDWWWVNGLGLQARINCCCGADVRLGHALVRDGLQNLLQFLKQCLRD